MNLPTRSYQPSTNSMVREFHEAFEIPDSDTAPALDHDAAFIRGTLVSEEYEEVMKAIQSGNPAAIAKELADLVYVAYGTAVVMGIDLDNVIREVHRSNMTKLGEDGKPVYREDGKVLKGPNYEEADIEGVIGYDTNHYPE